MGAGLNAKVAEHNGGCAGDDRLSWGLYLPAACLLSSLAGGARDDDNGDDVDDVDDDDGEDVDDDDDDDVDDVDVDDVDEDNTERSLRSLRTASLPGQLSMVMTMMMTTLRLAIILGSLFSLTSI